MGLNLGVMSAAIRLDVSQYRKELAGVENTSSNTFKRIASAAAGYLTARAVFSFVTGAMAEFSKLEEGNNKLKYTFTEIREEAARTARQLSETYHISAQTATNSVADIGDMLTGFGFGQSDALNFARQIIERGIDVASFKGLDQTDTIQRMTAALTGETDSLKMMGVVIRQDTDDFRDQVAAIQAATGATETQAKAQAILAQIMQQTKNAAGDYLRPDAPRTYAQELTDLREALKQFKAEVGTQVQPIAQETVVKARELLELYNNLTPSAKSFLNVTTATVAAMVLLAKTDIGRNLMTAGGAADMEKLKELKKTRSDAVREASETRRHYMEIRNAAKEAQAVAAAEQQKLAACKARVAQEAALNEKARYQYTLATGSSRGFENLKSYTEAQASLRAQEVATNNSVEATRKLALAQKEARAEVAKAMVAVNASTTAVKANAAAATVGGRASLFLSRGFKAASQATRAFFAAIGPVGWTIIGISVAIEALSAAVSWYNSKQEEAAENARKAADEAAKAADENLQNNQKQASAMERLLALQKYENLNNAERQEAIGLLEALGIAYDETADSIDAMISRMGAEKRSLAELIALRKEELKQQRIAAIEESIRKNQAAIDSNDQRKLGWWGTFWRSAVSLGYWTGESSDLPIDSENETYYAENVKLRRELAKLKYGEVGFDGKPVGGASTETSEAQRKALNAVTELEWENQFDLADPAEQIRMVSAKMDELFRNYRRTGRYGSIEEFMSADRRNMSANELKDLRELVKLEQQRLKIRRDLDNQLDQARDNYSSFLDRAALDRERQEVEKKIKEASRAGNSELARTLIEEQLNKAKALADSLQERLQTMLSPASGRSLTQAELDRIKELQKEMEEAFSDRDRWGDRLDEAKRSRRSTQATVGAWSAEVLSAMLGPTSYEQEIARNSKKSVDLQRTIASNTDPKNSKKTETYQK